MYSTDVVFIKAFAYTWGGPDLVIGGSEAMETNIMETCIDESYKNQYTFMIRYFIDSWHNPRNVL